MLAITCPGLEAAYAAFWADSLFSLKFPAWNENKTMSLDTLFYLYSKNK